MKDLLLIPHDPLIGGVPPTNRLLDLPTVCHLSEDFISFGIVPKCLQTTRMVVLTNNHPSQDVEYSVDETSSYLHDIGIISISPDRGVIAAQDIVVLKIILTANCQSLVINNRIKIISNTLFKATTKRNIGSRHDKLKDRIKSRSRVETASRSDMVQSQTFSRSQYMNNMTLTGQNRTTSYPPSSAQQPPPTRGATGSKGQNGNTNIPLPGTPLPP